MILVALTGGIGAGKSTIAAHLEKLGAHVFDADIFARRVVRPGTPALRRIVDIFGESVLTASGELNRAKLGELIFNNPAAKAQLEGILHPAIGKLADESFATVAAGDPHAVVVYQIPLLVETGNTDKWDYIITAEAPEEVRVERLVSGRGMSLQAARARIASQASRQAREAVADAVIDTGKTLTETIADVEAVWLKLCRLSGKADGASLG